MCQVIIWKIPTVLCGQRRRTHSFVGSGVASAAVIVGKVKFKFFVRSYLTFHSGCESWRSTTTYYLVSQSFALLFYRGRINNWKCANTMEISCQELQTTTICPENSSSSYKAQWVKIISDGKVLFFIQLIFPQDVCNTMQLNLEEWCS